jgi:DNA-binding response OmpR family regulator
MQTIKNSIVLIVEDDEEILDLNQRLLEEEGITVIAARSLKEARELLKTAVPDAAVLDIMLPDGSGLDFLGELRETCDAPVLFLTAKATRDDVITGLAAGGNDYITKPYDINEFRLRVIGLLRLVNTVRKRKPLDAAGASLLSAAALLSERELSVALPAARGMSNSDIAKEVYLSESRVKTCLSGIYRKLGIAGGKDKRRLLAKMLKGV